MVIWCLKLRLNVFTSRYENSSTDLQPVDATDMHVEPVDVEKTERHSQT